MLLVLETFIGSQDSKNVGNGVAIEDKRQSLEHLIIVKIAHKVTIPIIHLHAFHAIHNVRL